MNAIARTTQISVVVAHEDPYLAAGISALLRASPDFVVVAGRPDDLPADVLVADYSAGTGRNAARTTRGIRVKLPAAVVITDKCTSSQIRQAVDAGVRGYLLQGCSADELSSAVRSVAEGGRYLPIPVAQKLADSLSYCAPTHRELDVLKLTAKGLCNKEIGLQLGVGEGTVKTHMKALFEKLDAASRTAAVAEAMRRGILLRHSGA
jgi:DNA-binding NarL/FixJ family response regulator